jgi:hypothetical protein
MVTGVLFLVPVCAFEAFLFVTGLGVLAEGGLLTLQSGLAQAGGLTGNYDSSVQQYYSSFTLGLRMIQVAIGVTIGLFVSQSIIYAFTAGSTAVDMAF